jgi:CheY-like chemotaxis protein
MTVPYTETGRQASERILVVDDDPSIRRLLRWALEEEGLVAEMAADGQDALDRLAGERPALVLLDMGLPRASGIAVADWIRGTYGSALPIVVMTADRQAAEKARRVGAIAHFRKPFDIDAVMSAVRHALLG